MELTREEKDVIFKIARAAGCDRDGDILTFVVREDVDVVLVSSTFLSDKAKGDENEHSV